MEIKPLATYILEKNETKNNRPERVAWSGILDKRYCIEIHRTAPYCGRLVIFDGQNDYKLLHTEDVEISYDARFGPDSADVNYWQDQASSFIDGIDRNDSEQLLHS